MSNFFVTSDKRRIFGLDLLRVLAIFIVIHSHGSHYLASTFLAGMADWRLPQGTDMFFVLSGFLIGSSVLSMAEENEKHQFVTSSLRLYLKMALRILPNYWVLLAVNYILVYSHVIPGDLTAMPMWRFASLTQNLVSPFYDFFWESWTLPIQWWFYILLPIGMLLIPRRRVKQLTPLLVLLVVAFALGFRISVADKATNSFWWDVWIRKTVASRCDCVWIGVVVAWVKRYYPVFWRRCRWWSLALGVILITVCCSVTRVIGSAYANVVYPTFSAVSICLLFPILDSWNECHGFFGKAVAAISLLSYALFLSNLMVSQVIDGQFSTFAETHGIMTYLLFWFVAFAFAFVIYYCIERWAMRLRNKI